MNRKCARWPMAEPNDQPQIVGAFCWPVPMPLYQRGGTSSRMPELVMWIPISQPTWWWGGWLVDWLLGGVGWLVMNYYHPLSIIISQAATPRHWLDSCLVGWLLGSFSGCLVAWLLGPYHRILATNSQWLSIKHYQLSVGPSPLTITSLTIN